MNKLVLICLFALWPAAVGAQGSGENTFWLVWERMVPALPDCAGETCHDGVYYSHRIDGMSGDTAHQFFARMAGFASAPTHANIRTPTSPLCFRQADEITPVSLPDPASLPVASAVETLRGLSGVFVDLRGVRGPQAFQGQFGEQAQALAEQYFATAGIPLLTREAAEASPANAVLSMRYSGEVLGCRPWSVSLSLKQRVVLARAPDILLHTTTWSSSARQDQDNADFNEAMAMEQVIISFVEAFGQANEQ